LDNITAGVREREDANRTRVAGHLDEIQGAVANILKLFRNGAVGFMGGLDGWRDYKTRPVKEYSLAKLPFLMGDLDVGDVLNGKWNGIAAANFCDRAADDQHVSYDTTIAKGN
jgi:hypothetical protein